MPYKSFLLLCALCIAAYLPTGCKIPQITTKNESKYTPPAFPNSPSDSANIALTNWRTYFGDSLLVAIIDTALLHNQELQIINQELEISKNEIMARRGEYLPFLRLKANAGVDRASSFTRDGAVEEQLESRPGHPFPLIMGDNMVGVYASWEIDIWKKLRNAKQAAAQRYLASIEGKNFATTRLIAEIAESYYELLGLDNLLLIINQNIDIQTNALKVVKLQKEAAKVSQLAVNRFEAQLLNTQNLRYAIQQKIAELENHITLLSGTFLAKIPRNPNAFDSLQILPPSIGIPSQLLANRPDIRQAEINLAAAKLDVQVARANFYPTVSLSAGVGLQSFNPVFLINPKAILFNLVGDLVAPLVNKNAIKATYLNANAKQIQAVYIYEQTILQAYVDVLNQLAKIDNYSKSYATKLQEVELLNQSVAIANNLFNYARADYAEVLLTQREALDAKMELVEIKLRLLNAKVNIYRALGGGWQ